MPSGKPVLFLAFANEAGQQHLRNLKTERDALERRLGSNDAFEVVVKENATLDDIVETFRAHRGEVVLFHYGGHAESYGVLLHSPAGENSLVGKELAGFLGRQRGLRFVFLNACSTAEFMRELIEAGVPAVVGTSLDVEDDVATQFATEFYGGLAAEKSLIEKFTLEQAFQDAESLVRASLAQAASDAESDDGLKDLSADQRSRRVAYRSSEIVNYEEADGRYLEEWPWALEAPGEAGNWTLYDAVRDPLLGLPPLPDDIGRPLEPFRYLHWFEREHARVFFGRGERIAEAYRQVRDSSEPIMLLYGQSGVGKSSFLGAGLLPRLEAEYLVRYVRRDPDLGLTGTLAEDLGCGAESGEIAMALQLLEKEGGRPTLFAVDQLDEAFDAVSGSDELDEFFTMLGELFGAEGGRPSGEFILSFRKEFLAEVEQRLDEHGLSGSRLFLRRLNREGVIEAVEAIARDVDLQSRYGLRVDEALPEAIATDLLRDAEAAIAPTLQVLLTRMWSAAALGEEQGRTFSIDLYRELEGRGYLLSHFLKGQLKELRALAPDAMDSGLAIDVLFFHTTPQGTAIRRSVRELKEEYAHIPGPLGILLEHLEALQLLDYDEGAANRADAGGYRLAHGTLAPIVRKRFHESMKPGQRLRRALRSTVDWREGGVDTLLGELELEAVDEGSSGMRAQTPAEADLIQASRKRVKRDRWRRSWLRRLVFATAVVMAGLALWARSLQKESESRELALLGLNRLDRGDLVSAFAFASSGLGRSRTREALNAAAEALSTPVRNTVVLPVLNAGVAQVVFGPGGRSWATVGDDGSVRVWDIENGDSLGVVALEGAAVTVAFNLNDSLLLTVVEDQTSARVWDAATGDSLGGLVGHTGAITDASFSADGATVVTASADSTSRLWTVAGDPLDTFRDSRGPIARARITPDGSKLVTLLESGRLRLWPLPGGEPSDLGGDHGQAALDLSPDGEQVAVAGDDGIVRIWSTETDAALGEFGHEEAGTEVLDVTFSHDGLSILTLWADSSIDVRVPNSRWTDEEVRETGSNRIIAASLGPGREFQHLNADWTFRGGYINQRRYDVDGVVETAAFNSRGTSIVAVSSDGVAWSLPVGETGEPESLPAEVGRVRKVAISDDDRWIVTASADSTVRVIESDGGAGVVIRVGGAVTDVAISPDGSRLATAAADSSVQIWDRGGDLLRSLPHPAKVNSIAFRADGHRLISAGEDGAARIWDVSSGQRLSQLIHNGPIRSAGFSRDGTLVFTVGMDSVSRIWEPPSGWTIQARLGGAGSAVLGAAMLRDGETVVSLTDRGAVRRSPALGGQDEWMLGSASQNGSSWLRPNGEYVASVTNGGRIHLWRTDAPASLRVLERGPGPVSSVAFRPELRFGPESGQVLSAGADGSIRAWSIAAGDTLAIDGSGKGPVVLSPDGSRAASWDPEGLVLVRSISSGDTVAIFSAGVVERMAFSPNGARIATVGRDATLRVWTLGGESVAAIAGFEEGVSKIEFDRAGRRIATVEPNGEVRVWSAATGHSLWRGGGGARRIRAVTFSPDGDSILTGDEHGVITVRSTRNWDSISALPAHSGAVSAIAFSTKGILASGGANGTLRVFSTGSREEVAAFRGHTDAITDLRFTPNGERLVTGSLDGTVRVWAVGPRALQWLAKGGLPIGLRAADLPQALTEDERADLVERR